MKGFFKNYELILIYTLGNLQMLTVDYSRTSGETAQPPKCSTFSVLRPCIVIVTCRQEDFVSIVGAYEEDRMLLYGSDRAVLCFCFPMQALVFPNQLYEVVFEEELSTTSISVRLYGGALLSKSRKTCIINT